MSHWDFRRNANSAHLLLRLGVERGAAGPALLAGTGLSASQLDDPELEIEAAQELRLIRNLQAALPNECGLGLEAGTRYHLTTYGIWGFALISSPTVRAAIELALRYLRLSFAFTAIRLVVDEDGARLVYDDDEVPDDVRTFLVERDSVASVILQREAFSRTAPIPRVQYRHPRPPWADHYAAVFGVTPEFGQPVNAVHVERPWLETVLPQANERTAQLCEAQCRELLERRRARSGLSARVRDELLRQPGATPSMEAIAARLHMTSRTLHRKLADEQTSFRALLDEVRGSLAEELLASPGLSVKEIAERLGYAEPSSFIHAFKRWKGVPPRAFR